MIDPISQAILRKIERAVKQSRKDFIAYRAQCPKCSRWQVKETLKTKGCYACGWKPIGVHELCKQARK